jgi:hypothetical protein
VALSRAMNGFGRSLVHGLQVSLEYAGHVYADRYHARALGTRGSPRSRLHADERQPARCVAARRARPVLLRRAWRCSGARSAASTRPPPRPRPRAPSARRCSSPRRS